MKSFEKILNILSKFVKLLLIISVTVIVLCLAAQVIARYVFRYGIPWSDELARYCLIYISILGAVIITQERGHISVSFLDNLLGKHALWVLDLIRILISAVFSFLVVSFTKDAFTAIMGSVSVALHIPMEIIYAVYPFSFSCMLLYQIFHFISDLRNAPWKKDKGRKEEKTA